MNNIRCVGANFSIAPTCGRANLLWASQISYALVALMKYEYPIFLFCIFEIINFLKKKQKFEFSKFRIFKILKF